jgi:hypothetical protein
MGGFARAGCTSVADPFSPGVIARLPAIRDLDGRIAPQRCSSTMSTKSSKSIASTGVYFVQTLSELSSGNRKQVNDKGWNSTLSH